MKVACIGNMNNMMFTLCRYLRDKNIDAHLFLFDDEVTHFVPEADSYDDSYKEYTTYLPIGKHNLYKSDVSRKVSSFLKDITFFIGTDVAPALLSILGKKINIFIPHGSDIYAYPFPEKPEKLINKIWWSREIYYIGAAQKIGIENAETIIFPDEYDLHFPFKDKLNCKGEFINTSGPMLYVPQYHNPVFKSEYNKLKYYSVFKKVREQYSLN